MSNDGEQAIINWAVGQIGIETAIARHDSGDNSSVYKIDAVDGRSWFVKIAPALQDERNRLEWLNGRAPVPLVVGFARFGDLDAILMAAVSGRSLSGLTKSKPGEWIAESLAKALRRLHAIDAGDCPFGRMVDEAVLVHGDACLPNIMVDEVTGELIGFIDVGEARVAHVDVDLSAGVWSLQYNMGPGFGLPFLIAYGRPNADAAMVETLRQQYASRP